MNLLELLLQRLHHRLSDRLVLVRQSLRQQLLAARSLLALLQHPTLSLSPNTYAIAPFMQRSASSRLSNWMYAMPRFSSTIFTRAASSPYMLL